MSNDRDSLFAQGERLGIIGGGTMAKALIFPLFDKGIIKPECVYVNARTDETLLPWRDLGCSTTTSHTLPAIYWQNIRLGRGYCWIFRSRVVQLKNVYPQAGGELVTNMCDVVLWAVTPQAFTNALMKGWNVRSDKYTRGSSLHISIMAGITLEEFTQRLLQCLELPSKANYELRTARAMVNLGAQVNCGCTLFTLKSSDADGDRKFIRTFFGATGPCIEVMPEDQKQAYDVLLGAGIGFIMPVIEAMCDGAVIVGASRQLSLQLVVQSLKGAVELLQQNDLQPSKWKDQVCVGGGPAIAAIQVLERQSVRHAMMSAVAEATKRCEDLGRCYEKEEKFKKHQE